jgi:hypothetical protein
MLEVMLEYALFELRCEPNAGCVVTECQE